MLDMNTRQLFLASTLLIMVFSITPSLAFAHPHSGQIMINGHTHEPQTEITPLNGMIGLEKTTIYFHAPSDNKLPWGFIEGNIANHVEGYPVIIQIFRNDQAVHFAQTEVAEDGDYEYKFRVLNSSDGHLTRLFEGDYTVKIFKVVYLGHMNQI